MLRDFLNSLPKGSFQAGFFAPCNCVIVRFELKNDDSDLARELSQFLKDSGQFRWAISLKKKAIFYQIWRI